MCGRYELNATPRKIRDHFRDLVPERDWHTFTPVGSYNIAPSLSCLVIRYGKGDKHNVIDRLAWGFRPHWAKRAWINARSETVFTTPTFRESARQRRCLVIATGWYEWKAAEPRKPKQPYYIHFTGDRVFAFAGVWTARKIDVGWQLNFAILTTEAHGIPKTIHDRMPLVLHPRHYAAWLSPNTEQPDSLLTPFDNGELSAYPVSTHVNNPKNDSPKCIERLSHVG